MYAFLYAAIQNKLLDLYTWSQQTYHLYADNIDALRLYYTMVRVDVKPQAEHQQKGSVALGRIRV